MVRHFVMVVAVMATIGFALGVYAQNPQPTDKGAEQIKLDGGKQGGVLFPHRRHQATLGDCLICHSFFAQEKGSIQKAKDQGTLAKKQVMNKLCIHCHRAQKQAGKEAGPTTCNKCHIKAKE